MSHSEYHLTQSLLESLLQPLQIGAVVLSPGKALAVKTNGIADIHSLIETSEIHFQYLPLESGDMSISNDPFSGGTTLDSFTCVLRVELEHVTVLLASRFNTKPHLYLVENLELEGLRVPPSPLFVRNKMNKPLLDNMIQHPKCPKDFSRLLLNTVDKLKAAQKHLEAMSSTFAEHFTAKYLNQYLDASKSLAKKQLDDWQESRIEFKKKWDDNLNIVGSIELKNQVLTFDFQNTPVHPHVHLTPNFVFGACWGAVQAHLRQHLPINSGTLSIINIKTPSQSWINAKYPQPTLLGSLSGVYLIAETLLQSMSGLSHRPPVAESGASIGAIEISFSPQEQFVDFVLGGTAATANQAGLAGASFWLRNPLDPSVELIEARYPLLVKAYTAKPNSGGTGTHAGGDALIKTFQVKQSCQLTWYLNQTQVSPKGFDKGKNGAIASVIHVNAHGKRQVLGSSGVMTLEANDTIHVHTASGGGYAI